MTTSSSVPQEDKNKNAAPIQANSSVLILMTENFKNEKQFIGRKESEELELL